ncbi:MAG TPA: hypothetical protein VEW48_25930 [Thermoanaerobaculia bacterium]|nr:hypothetical protein [Thermoanaerobaculia bacterium]
MKTITAVVPEDLLREAMAVTNKGIAETLIEGLELVRQDRFREALARAADALGRDRETLDVAEEFLPLDNEALELAETSAGKQRARSERGADE